MAKVIIIGCGVAGPALAIFLKRQGFEPTIYERIKGFADAGLSLLLQPNGLKVLSLLPGLFSAMPGKDIASMSSYSTLEEDEGLLGDNDVPAHIRDAFGYPMRGIRRTELIRLLLDTAEAQGIPIHWNHHLTDVEQSDESVKAVFSNGFSDTGAFLVGCDGLHSVTRAVLFGEDPTTFLGLTQTGGISPTPRDMLDHGRVINWCGNGAHMMAYPISDTRTSWAITLREGEARESWRAVDQHEVEKIKRTPVSQWGFGASELIETAEKIVKFGLYDRPELRSWHKGRVVLLGDAAHPTPPHLGQGANQTFEDIYHLTHLLGAYPGAAEDSATLETVFTQYERARIPRSTMLIDTARKQGESRVAEGVEACLARNEGVRAFMSDEGVMATSAHIHRPE
ncbi:FAD/NAD-P-binding domain-containing protein [Russula brevipes]|nr:FAD/NAD-P-binding domain-containing protein [Russula brevipes]